MDQKLRKLTLDMGIKLANIYEIIERVCRPTISSMQLLVLFTND